MVYHHDEPATIQSAGGGFTPNWQPFHFGINKADNNQFPAPRPVEWISGCAIMMRGQALRQHGLIDERFFYYNEEVELCFRIARAGWKILHVPKAKLWHKGVQRNYSPSPNVTYYHVRNFLLFLEKHHAPLTVVLKAWLQIIRTIVSFTIKPKWRNKLPHRDAAVQALRDYLLKRWGIRPTT